MKFLKKFLSLVLVIVMLIAIVPIIHVRVEAAGGKSLAELKAYYKNGWYWNHYVSKKEEAADYVKAYSGVWASCFSDSVTQYGCKYHVSLSYESYVGHYDCNRFDGGSQCYGFARKLAYDVYGTKVSTWGKSDRYNVKAGDVVTLNYGGSNEHTVFVESVSGRIITVGECNVYGSNDCRIRWGGTYNLDSYSSLIVYSAPYEMVNGGTPSYTIDISYITPFTTTVNSDTDVTAYDGVNGNTNGVLWPNEVCTILEVYTNGWCKLEDSLQKIKYVPISVFKLNNIDNRYITPFNTTVLSDANVQAFDAVNGDTSGFLWPDEKCVVLEVYTSGWCKLKDSLDLTKYVSLSTLNLNMIDNSYHFPFDATVKSSTDVQAYDAVGGNIYGVLWGNEVCTILEVYTNGWCKLRDSVDNIKYVPVNVLCTPLFSPSLSVVSGDSILGTTFTWNSTYSGLHYDVKIWKGQYWDGEAYHIEWNTYSGCKIKLPAGTYQAYVDATDYYGCKMSNVVEFTVAPSYKISHWAGGFVNGEGDNGEKTFKWMADTFHASHNGNTVSLDDSKMLTIIPNGYYIRNRVGTSAVTGIWGGYDLGVTVTQGSNDLYFEYYYDPYTYTVTYNLNGGTNSPNNPLTYNVLYGFILANPTREGYTFAGWTDANGNLVTGINSGKNASFATGATYTEFCSELAGRTIGDQTLTANWIANTYSVSYDANGGGDAPNPQTKTFAAVLKLSDVIPTRPGYTFFGWATNKDATEAEYLPGDEFNADADTTLYAVWVKGCPVEHSYVFETILPTCTENGYTIYTCELCGDSYTAHITEALGHSYSEAGACTVCGSQRIEGEGTPGDLDGDGIVSAKDLNMVKKYISGVVQLSNNHVFLADVSGDGLVTANDLNRIIRYIAGLIIEL